MADDALVGLLLLHRDGYWTDEHAWEWMGCRGCDWGRDQYIGRSGGAEAHAAHLAAVIEAHYAERTAEVEEWGFAIRPDYVEQVPTEGHARQLASGTDWPVVHRYVTEWSPADA